MIALISALALVANAFSAPPAAQKPVTLAHVFKLGQKMHYELKSGLQIQTRQMGLDTFIPEDLDLSYSFSTEVTKLKADGIAVVHYLRPTITQVDGETVDHGPVSHIEKLNQDEMLTVTPVNDIIDHQEVKKSKKNGTGTLRLRSNTVLQVGGLIGSYVQEIYRLSLFVGAFDTSLDFSPRLPLDEVSVGDTWKRTVGYQPQKLKGKDGKQAVQRLDYTYTYQGTDTWNGRKVYKITASLTLDTDLAEFFNQMMDARPDESGLKTIPLKLQANVDYYLDGVTMHTLAVDARTEGGFKIVLTEAPGQPIVEQTLKGKSTLRLVGVSQAK